MATASQKEASVSLNESDRRIKMIFEHLPRVGDTIAIDNVFYRVDRIVFNAIPSDIGLFGYPNIFCVPV